MARLQGVVQKSKTRCLSCKPCLLTEDCDECEKCIINKGLPPTAKKLVSCHSQRDVLWICKFLGLVPNMYQRSLIFVRSAKLCII